MRDNTGLLEEIQEFSAYILGKSKMPFIPYVDDGDWRPHAPRFEHQAPRYETSACTAFTVENQIQFFMKGVYNEEVDLSENFLALVTPIPVGKGVDPQKTYEAVRHEGMVPNDVLPMPRNIRDWTDTTRLTKSILAKGQYWLQQHTYQHEWLWNSAGNRPANYIEILKEALKTSPIGISVSAWETEIDQWGNEVYVSRGSVNNHKTLLVHIDKENYPWVYDSYEPHDKRLAKDHNIRRAKRIWINKKTVPAMATHIRILKNIIKLLMGQEKDILYYANAAINSGYDPTPNDEYLDEVSCAWSISKLENDVDPNFKRIPGTWTLNEYYASNPKFTRVTVPIPGTRIICATIPGKPIQGHCGVFMEDMTIASNDSRTGLFIKNYDLKTWIKRYVDKGGYQVFMYNKIA